MSCWTCAFQRIGGPNTFLGICTWFETIKEQPKQIPAAVVDKGCEFKKEKTR